MAGAPRGGQGGAQEREESSGRKAPWTVSVDQLAGGLWMSPILVETPHQCQIMTNGYGYKLLGGSRRLSERSRYF